MLLWYNGDSAFNFAWLGLENYQHKRLKKIK